jgi:type II secretory pathway pseudopilin PulG
MPNAFSLVEVVFSMAIFVFVAFALIGLLAVGIQTSLDSKERNQAATIAEQLCSVRRAAPTNDFTATTSPQPGFPLPALNPTSPAGNLATTPIYLTRDGATNATAVGADFAFVYNITPKYDALPAGNTTKGVSTVYMCLYWPPQASATATSTGHYEITTTFALP